MINWLLNQRIKNNDTVIMNKLSYVQEALRQLSDNKYYIALPGPIYLTSIPTIAHLVDELFRRNFISSKQKLYLTPIEEGCRARLFYILPKIHKDRANWPTRRISQYINSFLQPLAILHDSYIKDNYDFISKIRGQSI